MNITEILLLILGAVICVAGFVIPEIYKGRPTDPSDAAAREKLSQAEDESVENARRRIKDIISTESGLAQDETERAMEKLTNEKIMAINEYGRTVVDDIEKNHKEVMFLYDMLNNKTVDIKNTVRKAENIARAENTADAARTEKPAAHKDETPRPVPAAVHQTASPVKIPRAFAPAASAPAPEAAAGSMNDKIIEMHDAGMDDLAIARKLGIGVGEVKLKIGLVEAGRNNET